MTLALERLCASCGIPADSGVFDDSSIQAQPRERAEVVLASYQLHRNYCGVLTYFAQYVEGISTPETKGLIWEIRANGTPLAPYRSLDHIVNSWGLSGFPVAIRLEEGVLLQLVVRAVQGGPEIDDDEREPPRVGGRIMGRYWYNTEFGGAPNVL